MSQRDREPNHRLEIAREAAKILTESGHRDFGRAKRKAVERIGLRSARELPGNAEVEAALMAHQRLFKGTGHQVYVQELCACAIEALALFAPFHARAVGPLVTGNADESCNVTLHLFVEPPEDVARFLARQEIPFRTSERRLHLSASRIERVPTYEFSKDRVDVELLVFTLAGRRQAPLSPIDRRPMKRVGAAALAARYGPNENTAS